MQNYKIKEKAKQTSLERFGVEHPMQNSEIFEKHQKSSFEYKTYNYPSGVKTLYQGYENFCLDDLIYKENISENDICNEPGKVPEIWYEYEGKSRRYYPDIYISSENRIIEVKSFYTFEKDKELNITKGNACKNLGYNFEFRIYDKNGVLLEKIII